MLLLHTRCVLSSLRCNGHSLLLSSYLYRIGRIENPSGSACGHLISFCTVQQRTFCVARSLAIFCLSMTSVPGPVEFPDFWGSMVFHHQPIPRKGSGNNNNNNSKTEIADALLRYNLQRELANSDVPKVVNRITSRSATCYPKISILFTYTEHHYI